MLKNLKEFLSKSQSKAENIPTESINKLLIPYKDIDPTEVFSAVVAASRSGKSVFELSGTKPNEQNTVALLANIYRSELLSFFPSTLDESRQPTLLEMIDYEQSIVDQTEATIGIAMTGNHNKTIEMLDNPNSLTRHLMRTAYLARILTLECLHGQNIHPRSSVGKIQGFGMSYLGGVHPYHMVVAANMHDEPRNFTHSSKHDMLLQQLTHQIGLRKALARCFHEPVPTDTDIDETHDRSGAQKILRLADNFGKVVTESSGKLRLRTSLDEVCQHSRERQEYYINSEKNQPGTFWFNKDKKQLDKYLANERKAYEEAMSWWEKISGKSFFGLLKEINADPDKFKIRLI